MIPSGGRLGSLAAGRQTEAERIQTSILNEDLAALQHKGRDRLIYVRAKDVVEKIGVDLNVIAKNMLVPGKDWSSTPLLQAV